MGIKLHRNINCVPCAIKNKVLYYDILDKRYSIDVPSIGSLEFDMQCNHFISNTVLAMLFNNDYNVVLRHDGTGTIYCNGSNVIVKSFRFDVDKLEVPLVGVSKGGVLRDGSTEFFLDMYALKDNTFILSAVNKPLSIIFDGVKNFKYIADNSKSNVMAAPVLDLLKGEIVALGDGGSVVYKVVGQLNYSGRGYITIV